MSHLTIVHRREPQRIEYRRFDTGNPRRRPILVFLHEGLGCTASWKDIPQILGQRTQCPAFVYTRPGYGNSAPVPLPRKINYLHTEGRKVLPAVLDAAGITSYILIGHSDGGSISLIHGGGRPEGLRGIVTIAAHLFSEPVTRQGLLETREWYLNGHLKPKLARLHGSNTETAFWGWNDTWLSKRFIHWNIEKYLKFIEVPVAGIQGACDPYGTMAQLNALESGIRDCRIHLVDDCGHVPHFQQQDTTLQLITKFVLDLLHKGV